MKRILHSFLPLLLLIGYTIGELVPGSTISVVRGDTPAEKTDSTSKAEPSERAPRNASDDNRADKSKPSLLEQTVGQHDKALVKPPADGQELTLAVLGFEDKGPSIELAVLRKALAETLTGDLSKFQGLRMVERIRVDQFLREAGLEQQGLTEASQVEKVGQALAAQYLISGSFSGKDNQITIDATLSEVGQKEVLAAWKGTVDAEQLLELEQDLLEQVLTVLAIAKTAKKVHPKPTSKTSPPVAVLVFANLSPSTRLQAMEGGFAEILQAELSAIANVNLVERQRLYDVLREQTLTLNGLTDPQTAVRIGQLIGAERMIYGSFVEVGKSLRIDARLVDTKTASLVGVETETGSAEDFASITEALSQRLAALLATDLPEDLAERTQNATPTRKLEAALHFAAAEDQYRSGNFSEASASYGRALLVEKENPYIHVRKGEIHVMLGEFDQAIESLETSLSDTALNTNKPMRFLAIRSLASAYWRSGQWEQTVKMNDALLKEFPTTPFVPAIRMNRSLSLMYMGRRDQAIKDLEDAVTSEAARNDKAVYFSALRSLFEYFYWEMRYIQGGQEYQTHRFDQQYNSKISTQTKESATRAIELYERIVDETSALRDQETQLWARMWIPDGTDARYLDEGGVPLRILDDRQREALLAKAVATFSWDEIVTKSGGRVLAELREKLGDSSDIMKEHQLVLDKDVNTAFDILPVASDQGDFQPFGDTNARIFAISQIAAELEKKSPAEATKRLQDLVVQYGLTHFAGVTVAGKLKTLGADYQYPEKAALVWGGGTAEMRDWGHILKPKGYVTHRVGLDHITAADLAPYSLVVLVRTGFKSYDPQEVLALRSYVATGGSLVVVVSPAWEPAATGIHNSLLSFFGVKAVDDFVVRAHSTKIAEHPITKGIESAMAKCAIHLEVPEGTALVQAGERTVLAAMPYRNGRIVVASFGQWFDPHPQYPLDKLNRPSQHWTEKIPIENRAIETGEGVQLPLLNNVVDWLLAEDRLDEAAQRLRRAYVTAQSAQA